MSGAPLSGLEILQWTEQDRLVHRDLEYLIEHEKGLQPFSSRAGLNFSTQDPRGNE